MQLSESLRVGLRGAWGAVVGFMLSIFFQGELRPFVTPRIEVSIGDVLRGIFGSTQVYSLSPLIEFAVFGASFLLLASLIYRSRKGFAVGMAACGVLDVTLLLASWSVSG
jgi:hypothetical protein